MLRGRALLQRHARGFFTWAPSEAFLSSWTKNQTLREWVTDRINLFQPARVHLCDGSDEEHRLLLKHMVQTGMLIKLDEKLRPGSYLARSDKSDVARVEDRTFICSDSEGDAGPTNNWIDPLIAQRNMNELFASAMQGRTMYVVPFSMGPIGSPISQIGVQITDSPYVVASMRIMTRMGKAALDALGEDGFFVPCMHSVGKPIVRGVEDAPWPCVPDQSQKWIMHFPEQRRIWSYGSGYGGNALLGKKCFALRIASAMARDEGWLAEHMLIVGITNPKGVKKYFAAAFPSACGKTNLAMMEPRVPGWKVECVGDDIAWMKIGPDGRLYAINPEAGFFGVAPGTSMDSNPNAMKSLDKNVIFTNCAVTPDNDVWWEGMTREPPQKALTWMRTEWFPGCGATAAHPNARFTVSASQCPVIDPKYDDPNGVPISGIIFGGRRSSNIPLVFQARDWHHGTFVGAVMTSETTAAAAGKRGVLRADPFAMMPFCGYNMGDYFEHWLSFTEMTSEAKLPKIFHVNWFRKSPQGKFMWPGFGDNIRVLEWIFNRCDAENDDDTTDTPVGLVPKPGAINTQGLDISSATMDELLHVDNAAFRQEAQKYREFLSQFKDRLPSSLVSNLDKLQGSVK
ncbi:phosphoenolpyruvate carboxykinase (GTP) [Plasmodiophora brassicae]